MRFLEMFNLRSSLSEPSHMERPQSGTLGNSLNKTPSRSQTPNANTCHMSCPSWTTQPNQVFRGSKFLLTSHGAELPRWAQSTNRIKRDNKVVFYCYHSKCSGLKQHTVIFQFRQWEAWCGSHCTEIKMLAEMYAFWRPQGTVYFLPFSASGGCPHSSCGEALPSSEPAMAI